MTESSRACENASVCPPPWEPTSKSLLAPTHIRRKVVLVLALAACDPSSGRARYPHCHVSRVPLELLCLIFEFAAASRQYRHPRDVHVLHPPDVRFVAPSGVAVTADGHLVISDRTSIWMMSPRGDVLWQRPQPEPGVHVRVMTCLPDGCIVCFSDNDAYPPIRKLSERLFFTLLSPEGAFVRRFVPAWYADMHFPNLMLRDATADSGNVVFLPIGTSGFCTYVMNIRPDGSSLCERRDREARVYFRDAQCVAAGPCGDIRVAEILRDGGKTMRIIFQLPGGHHQLPGGHQFAREMSFATPLLVHAMAVDDAGNSVLAVRMNAARRVCVFDSTGDTVWATDYASDSSQPSEHETRIRVAVLHDGRIAVCDALADCIFLL